MTTPMLLITIVLGVFVAFSLVAPLVFNVDRFAGHQRLFCPTHDTYGDLTLHAGGAALSAAYGEPYLRVRRCTLRGDGEPCPEDCLAGFDA